MGNYTLLLLLAAGSVAMAAAAATISKAEELLSNQFLRQAVENLEQELARESSYEWRQQRQLPRSYTIVQVDDEGRVRRASREQLLGSDILDELIDKILRSALGSGRRQASRERHQQQQQQEQPIMRWARDQAPPMPEETSDLSIPGTRLLPESRPSLVGLAWARPDSGEPPRQQGSPAKRFRLDGIEFKGEAEQQAEPYAPTKQGASRGSSGDDDGGASNRTNGGGGGGGKQNSFTKPDALLANMVGSSLEAKRVENSRWNNLRGMWGKRSVQF